MDFFKNYYTDMEKTSYQGIYILCFDWKVFKFDWFTDCGEWFIYVYFGKRWIRLMSGFDILTGKRK